MGDQAYSSTERNRLFASKTSYDDTFDSTELFLREREINIPKGYEIRGFYLLLRHGARQPHISDLKDLNLKFPLNEFRSGTPIHQFVQMIHEKFQENDLNRKLTNFGEKNMKEIAKRYQKRLPNLFSVNQFIEIVCSTRQRTLQSALAFLQQINCHINNIDIDDSILCFVHSIKHLQINKSILLENHLSNYYSSVFYEQYLNKFELMKLNNNFWFTDIINHMNNEPSYDNLPIKPGRHRSYSTGRKKPKKFIWRQRSSSNDSFIVNTYTIEFHQNIIQFYGNDETFSKLTARSIPVDFKELTNMFLEDFHCFQKNKERINPICIRLIDRDNSTFFTLIRRQSNIEIQQSFSRRNMYNNMNCGHTFIKRKNCNQMVEKKHLNLSDILVLFKFLGYYIANSMNFPNSINESSDVPAMFNIFDQRLRKAMNEFIDFKNFHTKFYPTNHLRRARRPLLKDIERFIRRCSYDYQSKRILFLRFGHLETILPLFSFLCFSKLMKWSKKHLHIDRYCPFAANIGFLLIANRERKHYIKLFINEIEQEGFIECDYLLEKIENDL
ncbi:hypothetical protein SNEBB_009917 [Seison nebaliae]|nr:hypothetical protein SNEBB_009917 [Seison nebaliae]